LVSGSVREETLGTTQGNSGSKGVLECDQSNGGCAVIALLIISASFAFMLTAMFTEVIIDIFCQGPLRDIREEHYPGEGYKHVTADQALSELRKRKLFIQTATHRSINSDITDAFVSKSFFLILSDLFKSSNLYTYIFLNAFQIEPGSFVLDEYGGDIFKNADNVEKFAAEFVKFPSACALLYFHDHYVALIKVK
jgi:hypothetical protein